MKGKYCRMMTPVKFRQLRLFLTLIIVLALAGLVALTAVTKPSGTVLAAQPFPGIYQLSFFANNPTSPPDFIPLTNNSLAVGEELILLAHITDISGHPAIRGSVIFQSCSLKGNPAPSAVCVSGSGTPMHLFINSQLME